LIKIVARFNTGINAGEVKKFFVAGIYWVGYAFLVDAQTFVTAFAIVNNASVSGITPTRNEAAYSAAKAGVIALTKSGAHYSNKGGAGNGIEQIRVTPETMSLEEISRLWGAIQSHYRPTAAYQASVVLIESRRSVRSALPVADDMRRIYVIPFRQPVIEGVVNADGDLAPIAAGVTLAIRGRELVGEGTIVNLDGIEVTPAAADLTPEQIALPLTSPLPAGLLAGVKGVQVIHRIKMGDPETDHRGTESNVAAFVLRPTITNGPVIGAGDIVGMTSSTELVDGVTVQLRAGNLRLDFDPNVGKEQRVSLFLNQLNAASNVRPRAYTFRAPAGNGVPDGSDDIASVDIPFVRVVAGTYLVRAQVNGAESLLAPDGTGAFATPQVTFA
jgi:hypothetical protein